MPPAQVPRVKDRPVVDGVVADGEWLGPVLTLRKSPSREAIQGQAATVRAAHDERRPHAATAAPVGDADKRQLGTQWDADDGAEVWLRNASGHERETPPADGGDHTGADG